MIKSLCRRGRAIAAEDKTPNRVPSCDSARARNAVFRPQGPAVARMGFFDGLVRVRPVKQFLLAILMLALSRPVPVTAQDETRYSEDPLLLGAGARPLGMGSAFVAVSDDATAIYWNPAGLERLRRRELQIQHAEQFGGTVNHDVFTLCGPSPLGGFGVGLTRLGVDGVKITTLENPTIAPGPDNRPVVSRVAGTTEYHLHLAFGRRLRSNLSAGAGVKLVSRNLDAGKGSGFGIDLGMLYNPRQGLTAGLMVRNLIPLKITFDSGSSDRVPPVLVFGLALARPVETADGVITCSGSFSVGEEKSAADSFQGARVGIEYLYRNKLALRLGARGNHFTAGAGVRLGRRVAFDLAFLEHGELDNTYRISGSLYF